MSNEREQAPLFDEEDVISTYTDGQAVEDGMLVRFDKTPNRCTAALWDYVEKQLPEGKPPNTWPVSLLMWFSGFHASAALMGLCDVHGAQAQQIYEKNVGGGIWVGAIVEGPDGRISELLVLEQIGRPPRQAPEGTRKVWLIPNEVGGLTAMFPEDY